MRAGGWVVCFASKIEGGGGSHPRIRGGEEGVHGGRVYAGRGAEYKSSGPIFPPSIAQLDQWSFGMLLRLPNSGNESICLHRGRFLIKNGLDSTEHHYGLW